MDARTHSRRGRRLPARRGIMFRSLRYRASSWSIVWRARLFSYWLKDNIGFFVMLGLPLAALGFIIHFAYFDHVRLELARQREVDLRCLAENVYFEARGEPLAGQYAVAEVTLNRVASRHFPDSVCEVVHEARWDPLRKRRVAHFSWTALQLKLGFNPTSAAWKQAMEVATAVYDGTHTPRVPGALFFHATTVDPYWAKTRRSVAKIGNHVFYR